MTEAEITRLASSDLRKTTMADVLASVFATAGPKSVLAFARKTQVAPLISSTGQDDSTAILLRLAEFCAEGGNADAIVEAALSDPRAITLVIDWARLGRRRDVLRAMQGTLVANLQDTTPLTRQQRSGLMRVAHALSVTGDLSLAYETTVIVDRDASDPRVSALMGRLSSQLAFLHQKPSSRKRGPRRAVASARAGMPIPSLLSNSLPFSNGGYATRSHGLIRSLRQEGWDVVGVTRAGFPPNWVTTGTGKHAEAEEVFDGVPYLRTPSPHIPPHSQTLPDEPYIEAMVRRITETDGTRSWQAVHSASNYVYGTAAARIGERLGIPSIYEVRGFWELSKAPIDPGYETTERYRLSVKMETAACEAVDRVLAITEAAKGLLVERGVEPSKITVVPNGVDSSRFTPRQPNHALKESLGFKGKVVIGYLGSLRHYEGIPLLIEAVGILRRDSLPVTLLIVGDGEATPDIHDAVRRLSLQDHVVFTGRVPHTEVDDYYSIVDVLPLPRLPMPLTEIISPIKPFEAMAMQKAIVVSDVAALAEIVQHDVTGLLAAKGDAVSLAHQLARLVQDADLRARLGANAREWVIANRDWRSIAQIVTKVYESLGLQRER